jgi:hypothetical protein
MGPAQQRPDRRPGPGGQGGHLPPLARHAVGRFTLVSTPGDTGSLRKDLISLVERWTLPLDREERAAASIVGAARHEEELRAGLDDALVRPLQAAVKAIGQRAAERGEPVPECRLTLLGSVLQAFWWQRYTAAGDGAMTQERVEQVVDDVLLPVVVPTSGSTRAKSTAR